MESLLITFLKYLYCRLWLQHMSMILCLSETFLDSLFNSFNDQINMEGCNLLTADHRNDIKRGGGCMYFKEHLPTLRSDDV